MAGKIKVLVIGPLPPPYHGVATFVRDLLGAQTSSLPSDAARMAALPAFEWLHLDTSDHRDAKNLGRWDLVNVCLGLSHLAQLAGRCLRARPDIVYLPISQNKPAFLRDALFILQSRLLGCRVVLHLHGGYFRTFYERELGAISRALARVVLRRAAAVIVLGEELRPIFADLVKPERVYVVENGVPDSGVWPLAAQKPVTSTVLYMSTLTRTKGILELLRALSLLRRKWPGARLRVAGEWADEALRAEALALIEAEKLAAQVSFVGAVEGAAKAAFLASGDIFCLPTRYPYEGQPLVILEALAAGLPVLSTTQGVIASTLGGCAGQALPGDLTPELLSETLDKMLGDEARLRACGQAARQRYLEKYTLEACHTRLAGVFEKVMA